MGLRDKGLSVSLFSALLQHCSPDDEASGPWELSLLSLAPDGTCVSCFSEWCWLVCSFVRICLLRLKRDCTADELVQLDADLLQCSLEVRLQTLQDRLCAAWHFTMLAIQALITT